MTGKTRGGRRAGRLALALLAPLAMLSTPAAAAQAAATSAPAAASPSDILPPIRFPGVDVFLDAIGIDEAAVALVDSFRQPAAEALVAANPDKAGAARAVADRERAAEIAMYRPLVAFTFDSRAVELLNPQVEQRLAALQARQSAGYGRTRSISPERLRHYQSEAARIAARPAARANAQVLELARLARTPDGVALRELQKTGLFYCLLEARNHGTEQEQAECAGVKNAPPLQRLRKVPMGADLIRLSSLAHLGLNGMMQMGHAAGMSLHRLLPPEKVRAAGLAVPPDQSLQDLMKTHATKAPRS